MPPVLKLTDHILEILGDGEPHFEIEIATKLLRHVPPEHAARKAKMLHKGASEPPLFRKVQMGMNNITHSALGHLEKRGKVAREEVDGKRAWRLIDQETLAWLRAARGAGG